MTAAMSQKARNAQRQARRQLMKGRPKWMKGLPTAEILAFDEWVQGMDELRGVLHRAYDAHEYGKFSPEGARFAARKIDALLAVLDEWEPYRDGAAPVKYRARMRPWGYEAYVWEQELRDDDSAVADFLNAMKKARRTLRPAACDAFSPATMRSAARRVGGLASMLRTLQRTLAGED